MRVVGIDPGSRYTGYGVIQLQDGKIEHLASGRINATSAKSFSQRLEIIFDALSHLIATHDCTDAAIESLFVSKNVQSALKLGHARGVAILAAIKHGLTPAEYPPTRVKEAVTGSGHADKEHIKIVVATTLKLKTSTLSYDAADALAIAICHARTAEVTARLSPSVTSANSSH